jgi:cytochrome c-type biogenesis protein CcmF
LAAIVVEGNSSLLGVAGIALGAWVASGSVVILLRRVRAGTIPVFESLRLAVTLPRATYGMIVAHLGMGLLVIGIAGAEAWKSENVIAMREGETTVFAGYSIAMQAVTRVNGPGYQAQRAVFAVCAARPTSSAPPPSFAFPARQMHDGGCDQSDLRQSLCLDRADDADAGRQIYFHP